MGFTTKGEETRPGSFTEREDVRRFVEKFAEEQGWTMTDVRNRAIMYYAMKYKRGELDDPMVDDGITNRVGLDR